MAFSEWAWWKKLVVIVVGVVVFLALFYLVFDLMYFRIEGKQKADKAYQLLPIAVLGKQEEYLLDDDLLKDEAGKLIGIKLRALQISLDRLRLLFEVLADEGEQTEAAVQLRQSLIKLIRKSLLADQGLIAQLKGEPGRTGNVGRAGKDGKDAKVDEAMVSQIIDRKLSDRLSPKETLVTDHTQEIAGLRAEVDAKLAEFQKRLDGLMVTKRTKITGDAKIRLGGDDE